MAGMGIAVPLFGTNPRISSRRFVPKLTRFGRKTQGRRKFSMHCKVYTVQRHVDHLLINVVCT